MKSYKVELVNAIETVLRSDIGLGIDIFGLSIYPNEDGSWAVHLDESIHPEKYHQDFETIKAAIKCFLKQREKLELGFDFEVE